MPKQFNVRLPEITLQQMEEISLTTGLSMTQIVVIAIDRLARTMLPSKGQSAKPQNIEGE